MGNIHIANGSTKFIRARATQERIVIKEIDASGSLSAGLKGPFSLNGSVKASLDRVLDTTGFARLAPGEALEFDVDFNEGDVYVTVTTADDPEPYVIAYNFTPPEGRSVIVTPNNTLQLSQKFGDIWQTEDGVPYGPKSATWVQKQCDLQQPGCQQGSFATGGENKKIEAGNGAVPVTTSNSCCVIM